MSKDIREMINKVRNFGKLINENLPNQPQDTESGNKENENDKKTYFV